MNGTRVTGMTLRGTNFPIYNGKLYIEEGTRVRDGVENGLLVRGSAINVQTFGVLLDRVSVGLGFDRSLKLSAMRSGNCDYRTGRGMINVADLPSRPTSGSFATRFIINNARFLFQQGHGNRAITMDYGNSTTDPRPVNLQGSELKNSNFENSNFFTVDFNRTRELRIFDNIIRGGGGGTRSGFVHPLHFEDNSFNIVVERNTLIQRQRDVTGRAMTSRSHIWAGGNNGIHAITVRNNETMGSVNTCIAG